MNSFDIERTVSQNLIKISKNDTWAIVEVELTNLDEGQEKDLIKRFTIRLSEERPNIPIMVIAYSSKFIITSSLWPRPERNLDADTISISFSMTWCNAVFNDKTQSLYNTHPLKDMAIATKEFENPFTAKDMVRSQGIAFLKNRGIIKPKDDSDSDEMIFGDDFNPDDY